MYRIRRGIAGLTNSVSLGSLAGPLCHMLDLTISEGSSLDTFNSPSSLFPLNEAYHHIVQNFLSFIFQWRRARLFPGHSPELPSPVIECEIVISICETETDVHLESLFHFSVWRRRWITLLVQELRTSTALLQRQAGIDG